MLALWSETTNMHVWQKAGWKIQAYNVPTLGTVMDLSSSRIELTEWKLQERFEHFELTGESIAGEFRRLVTQWRAERGATSSISQMITCPAYQQIIALGPAVIPLLLHELERDPDHWFAALRTITGENPVKPEHRGDLMLMSQDWLQWAKEQGY